MQRRFASFECRPRHIVITGRAWHEGGSAEAAGEACRRTRSGGVVAAASIRRWRAGRVSRPALPSSGSPGVIDATRSVVSFAACATGCAVHTSATSAANAQWQATAVRESRIFMIVPFVPGPAARRARGYRVDCRDGDGRVSRRIP